MFLLLMVVVFQGLDTRGAMLFSPIDNKSMASMRNLINSSQQCVSFDAKFIK